MARNNMEPIITTDAAALAKKFAEWMIEYIEQTLQRQDRFTLVLSGGNTPKKLYQLLASPEYAQRIDWPKLHFFWGDERHVPFDDERNNAKMAFDTLLNHVAVKKDQVHIMRTDIGPEESADEYEKILRSYFTNTPLTFDLVLLGLGDNAHTLSLFPGYDNIYERRRWVMSFYLTEQNVHRVTLTTPIVNAAARVAFLVSGADKAVALNEVMYGDHNPDLYPAQLIQPYAEKPYWFVDKAATLELED
jgi:6-phosphogluconolactonase